MRSRHLAWLVRGLAVAALTMIVALLVLAQPVLAPYSPAAKPTLTATAVSTSPVPPTRTLTPTPPPTPPPTLTPVPTVSSTPSPAPPPTATETPLPTATPTTDENVALTATAEAHLILTAPPETPAPVELVGRMEQHGYMSQTTGAEELYRIYLPPGYDQTDRRYPVLYLLHGWPYDDAHWDILGADEVADAAIMNGTLPPFIVVMPRGSERLYIGTSGGNYSFEAQVINDLIPHVDGAYRSWAQREGRAIGGMSRGGVWALEIALYHADMFAVVGAHSPALAVNLALPPHDPFYLLDKPGVAALRIYLDAGDGDWARGSTQALHEALNNQGISHEYVVHEGRHANDLWAANVAEYLAFYAAGWPRDAISP